MGRQILVKLLRLLRPEARPDDVAEIVEVLLRAEMRDAKSDVKQWITLENGTHVPVGKNGVIQGKGGLRGQKVQAERRRLSEENDACGIQPRC